MYLDIPVLVQIVDTSDTASVTVGVINMANVPCAVAWVTGNHTLGEKKGKSLVMHKDKALILTAFCTGKTLVPFKQ